MQAERNSEIFLSPAKPLLYNPATYFSSVGKSIGLQFREAINKKRLTS